MFCCFWLNNYIENIIRRFKQFWCSHGVRVMEMKRKKTKKFWSEFFEKLTFFDNDRYNMLLNLLNTSWVMDLRDSHLSRHVINELDFSQTTGFFDRIIETTDHWIMSLCAFGAVLKPILSTVLIILYYIVKLVKYYLRQRRQYIPYD